jgi:xanthine/uracil/vitamin C permease (AzgA family)
MINKSRLDKIFRLSENGSNVSTEITAGITTFLTMAYIIVVQPMVLSGRMFGFDTGVDFGAVMTATCVSSALATAIMGIYARYPIAQALVWVKTFSLFFQCCLLLLQQVFKFMAGWSWYCLYIRYSISCTIIDWHQKNNY